MEQTTDIQTPKKEKPKQQFKYESIPLHQLASKVYTVADNLPQDILDFIGELEDCWDMCIHGESGNGKTNLTVKILVAVITAFKVKCDYISWEEGHGKTIQNTLIHRHNLLEVIGNNMTITKGMSYDALVHRLKRKQSARLVVMDSVQAAGFTKQQIIELRETFVLAKKHRKMLIFISWGKGGTPIGAAGIAAEFNANIKIHVDRFIAFPKSRFGGNKNYVIWEEGAMRAWEEKYWRKAGIPKPVKSRKKKEKLPPPESTTTQSISENSNNNNDGLKETETGNIPG